MAAPCASRGIFLMTYPVIVGLMRPQALGDLRERNMLFVPRFCERHLSGGHFDPAHHGELVWVARVDSGSLSRLELFFQKTHTAPLPRDIELAATAANG